jgi:hypothetical protein
MTAVGSDCFGGGGVVGAGESSESGLDRDLNVNFFFGTSFAVVAVLSCESSFSC